jgi:hypothetical protein
MEDGVTSLDVRRTPEATVLVLTAALLVLGGCAGSSGTGAKSTSTAVAAAAPAPKSITYAGGDGHDCAHRVIVQGASGELDGVSAEYDWLAQKSPGYKRKFQSLTKCDGQPSDKVTIETASGDTVDVYFDISDFFGKGL